MVNMMGNKIFISVVAIEIISDDGERGASLQKKLCTLKKQY